MGAKKLMAYSDSQVVVKQVSGDYTAKETNLYLDKIQVLIKEF